MKFHAFVAVTLALFQTGLSSALPDSASVTARQDRRGSEQIPGLGSRKQQVISAGGNTMDLAVAMLETTNMGTDYPYGQSVNDVRNGEILKYVSVALSLEISQSTLQILTSPTARTSVRISRPATTERQSTVLTSGSLDIAMVQLVSRTLTPPTSNVRILTPWLSVAMHEEMLNGHRVPRRCSMDQVPD
ncbi:unnamed protein product [Aspergillus oryzae]|nr:unnamed protein product [Aspergillus oryzae]